MSLEVDKFLFGLEEPLTLTEFATMLMTLSKQLPADTLVSVQETYEGMYCHSPWFRGHLEKDVDDTTHYLVLRG